MADEFFESGKEQEQAKLNETENNFTDKEIKDYLEQKELVVSNICMGIVGDDGTGKSGIALDVRTEQEIKDKKEIFVFDLDFGCAPIKLKYHNNDSNIKIYDPTEYVTDKNGIRIDYKRTMEKIKTICSYLIKNKENYPKVKTVIIDGVDRLLKIAEYQMKVEKHLQPDGRADYAYWNKRNIDYQQVMDLIKKLPWDKIYITHEKEVDKEQEELKDKIRPKATRVKLKPAWEKKSSDMMYQIIETYREDSNDKVEYKAHIRKWKGKAELEGKDIVFCTVDKTNGNVNWKGLKEVINS